MNAAKINKISKELYGYDAITIDPIAALWLAEHILKTEGKNLFKRISSMRRKQGLPTAFPQYNTDLFNTF